MTQVIYILHEDMPTLVWLALTMGTVFSVEYELKLQKQLAI